MTDYLHPDIALILDELLGHCQAHDIQGHALGVCIGCQEDWPCPGYQALGALERIAARLEGL